MTWFAGIDWGSAEHAACVVDERGEIVASFVVQHTAESLAKLLTQLARIAPAADLPIAIERPTGLLVDTLFHAGHPVVPIHPNAVSACRSRYSMARGKSDAGDAYILADMLRTDGHRFRVLEPASDKARALKNLVRHRGALVRRRVAVGNELRALAESFWPGAVALFTSIEANISLAFLERYPTPTSASRLGEKRLAAFLRREGYPGTRTPAELLARLRSAPIGLVGEFEEAINGDLVKDLVAVLRTVVQRIKRITGKIEELVAQLETGRLMMSFPFAGKVNAAQIVAEIGDDPKRFPSESQLAAEAGIAPVTFASGKRRSVAFRYACNKRLRVALTTWAFNTTRSSPWAKSVYAKARARGCDHPHAVRILTRAWVRVLWRCWQDGRTYDPEHHGAARQLAEATVSAVLTQGG